LPADVAKDADVVERWQVWLIVYRIEASCFYDPAQLYPTLSRIALDILPGQASSVPSKRLFSASKQTPDDRRGSLGSERFEELRVYDE
jgi:hypothetical protein